jgi:hypothetical protein
LQVVDELPAHEVGRALARHLLAGADAGIDHVPGVVVRRAHQHAVALADVDDIDLQQPGIAHRAGRQPAGAAACAHLDPFAIALDLLQRVAPQQGAQRLAGIVLQRQLEATAGVVEVLHGASGVKVGLPRGHDAGRGTPNGQRGPTGVVRVRWLRVLPSLGFVSVSAWPSLLLQRRKEPAR